MSASRCLRSCVSVQYQPKAGSCQDEAAGVCNFLGRDTDTEPPAPFSARHRVLWGPHFRRNVRTRCYSVVLDSSVRTVGPTPHCNRSTCRRRAALQSLISNRAALQSRISYQNSSIRLWSEGGGLNGLRKLHPINGTHRCSEESTDSTEYVWTLWNQQLHTWGS